jgi:hypothetical protein
MTASHGHDAEYDDRHDMGDDDEDGDIDGLGAHDDGFRSTNGNRMSHGGNGNGNGNGGATAVDRAQLAASVKLGIELTDSGLTEPDFASA